jgi:hypothetical protein
VRAGRSSRRPEPVTPHKEEIMSIVKVIEVLAESDKSWEDATQNALTEASKTVKNIQNIYIKEMQAIVQNNSIATYRVNAKVSFLVE